jgi:hypothetical protein
VTNIAVAASGRGWSRCNGAGTKTPTARALLVPLIAFIIGAGGATLTYAAVDSGSIDLTSGDGPAAKQAPHAGTGGVSLDGSD